MYIWKRMGKLTGMIPLEESQTPIPEIAFLEEQDFNFKYKIFL